jgi:uracil-DNA glycosylase family 4
MLDEDGGKVSLPAWLLDRVRACAACERMHRCHVLSRGNGPADARVLFVAEAPGRFGAARTGIPLSGDASGQRFERLLAIAGIARNGVFVTNAVLCNPLDGEGRNRRPSAAEVVRCRPFLEATLDAVRPRVVVALGAVALQALDAIAPHGMALTRDAGTASPWRGVVLWSLYHPSRQSTLHRAEELQREDWRRLGRALRTVEERGT